VLAGSRSQQGRFGQQRPAQILRGLLALGPVLPPPLVVLPQQRAHTRVEIVARVKPRNVHSVANAPFLLLLPLVQKLFVIGGGQLLLVDEEWPLEQRSTMSSYSTRSDRAFSALPRGPSGDCAMM